MLYTAPDLRSSHGVRCAIPLTRTTDAAMPYLPAALVGTGARAALEAITNELPATLTRRLYFECRLAAEAPAVDLVLCVDRASRRLLVDPHRAWLPRHLQTNPLWAGLSRLCSEWTATRSRVGARIYDLWLEFDAPDPAVASHPFVPSIFIGLVRTVVTPPSLLGDAALECLRTVTGRPIEPDVAAAVRRVVAALPRGASLPYVGLMYPRSTRAIRLCVGPLRGRSLLDFLGAIEWPGSADEVGALLGSLACGDDGMTALDATTLVHIDVLEGVQPRLGLEIPFQQHRQMVGGISEVTLLDAACSRGLCAPAKRDHLLQWPGYSIEQFAHQCWSSLALRRVSHVKAVLQPGRRPELKTYLSFFHDFSRRHS